MRILQGLAREGQRIQTATAQAEVATQQAQETATAQAQTTSTAQAVAAASTVQAQATAKADAAATAAVQAQATVLPATATMQACIHDTELAPADWVVVFCDTFSTNENDWYTGEYDGDLISGEKLLAGGKYRWDATVNGDAIWWSIPDVALDEDFYATVEIRRVSGVESGQYGLVFRKIDKENYAIFKIRDSSSFKFSLRHEGEWNTVIDWTETSAVLPSQVNRVTVIAQGAHYTFYVNDQYVGDAEDDRLNQGKAGMMIELVDAGDAAIFEFDNLEIRAP
jgi:hypothetical protein